MRHRWPYTQFGQAAGTENDGRSLYKKQITCTLYQGRVHSTPTETQPGGGMKNKGMLLIAAGVMLLLAETAQAQLRGV